jgi:mRNA interferase RelE/StbE
MAQVAYASAARKTLDRMPSVKRNKVRAAINGSAADPFAKNNNVTPLTGRKNGYRIRVGDWRVILALTPGAVVILDVLPRGKAYMKKNRR